MTSSQERWCIAAALAAAVVPASAAHRSRQSPVPPPTPTIVRTDEAYRHHDPAVPHRTAAALDAYRPACGAPAGLFDLLAPGTSRAAAMAIVRQLDALDVTRTIEQAFARAAAALPGPPMTVCVYAVEMTKGMPYLAGVGGTSMGGGRIHIYLHPTDDRAAKLPYTIAHEYFHEVERLVAPPRTADEVLVSEGKADYFALQLYPALRPPHTQPQSADELAAAWRAFDTHRRLGVAAFRSQFMIAAPPSRLPMWAGYKLGFEVVRQALSGPSQPPSTWHAIPAADMIGRFVPPGS